MRIHLTAAVYVLFFSPFLGVTRSEYGVLLLTIAMVIAAGAVLVCAVFAAFVGIAVLWRPEAILALLVTIVTNPLYLVLFILSLVLAFFFIFKGPCGVREKLHKK